MGRFRSSKASVVIATASVLAGQTAGAHAASQKQHLRHRNLMADDITRDFEHLGCFRDRKEDRIMEHQMTDTESMTAEFCYDHCVSLGAPLMATQWSIECWCAEEVEVDFDRHGEAECDHPCAGDKDEMCGGYDAFDLYLIEPNTSGDDGDDRDDGGDGGDGGNYVPSTPTPPAPTPSPVTPPTPSPVPAPTPSPVTPASEPDTSVDGALVPDIVKIVSVEGDTPGGLGWADSYSIDGRCFMHTTFDHEIGDYKVDTPQGEMTIRDLYKKMGPGPGRKDRPLYNDIQCGNGPANNAPDEVKCPGLVEYGREGCGQLGPKWDLSGMA